MGDIAFLPEVEKFVARKPGIQDALFDFLDANPKYGPVAEKVCREANKVIDDNKKAKEGVSGFVKQSEDVVLWDVPFDLGTRDLTTGRFKSRNITYDKKGMPYAIVRCYGPNPPSDARRISGKDIDPNSCMHTSCLVSCSGIIVRDETCNDGNMMFPGLKGIAEYMGIHPKAKIVGVKIGTFGTSKFKGNYETVKNEGGGYDRITDVNGKKMTFEQPAILTKIIYEYWKQHDGYESFMPGALSSEKVSSVEMSTKSAFENGGWTERIPSERNVKSESKQIHKAQNSVTKESNRSKNRDQDLPFATEHDVFDETLPFI